MARILVITLAAMTQIAIIQHPADASDTPPESPSNPSLVARSSNVEFGPVFELSGRDVMHADIDIDASLPGRCLKGPSCQVTIDFGCLEPTGRISPTLHNGRTWKVTGSEFRVSYSPSPYWFTGCKSDAVAHTYSVHLSIRSSTSVDYPASESYLVEYNDFALAQYLDDLSDAAAEDDNYARQCAKLANSPAIQRECLDAAAVVAAYPNSNAARIPAAILSAGGTTGDLLALLEPTYEDPIPPAPAGHEILDGYDLDAIAANIDAEGGLATLVVLVNAAPCTNSNGGSTTDCAEAVLTGEASGFTTRQVIGGLVATFGTGILMSIVAGVIGPSNGHAAKPTPPAPRPHPAIPSKGSSNHAPTTTIEPDQFSVNEVLRSWYQRMHQGNLGPSSVVSTMTDPSEEESLRSAARTCLKQASAAARAGATFASANPCQDMPILFPAGSADGTGILNAYEAAQHDLEAIGKRPEWFQLNYMSRTTKRTQVPVRWFDSEPYASVSGCKWKSSDQNCDEYPFYSSTQGGPISHGGSGASLKPVNSDQNSIEGSVFGVMVSKCKMESAQAALRGTPANGGTPFIVVPMPDVPAPTFFLC